MIARRPCFALTWINCGQTAYLAAIVTFGDRVCQSRRGFRSWSAMRGANMDYPIPVLLTAPRFAPGGCGGWKCRFPPPSRSWRLGAEEIITCLQPHQVGGVRGAIAAAEGLYLVILSLHICDTRRGNVKHHESEGHPPEQRVQGLQPAPDHCSLVQLSCLEETGPYWWVVDSKTARPGNLSRDAA
jgi:hypothetical protein